MHTSFASFESFIPFSSRVDLQPLVCNFTPAEHIHLSESVDSFVMGTYNVLFPQKINKRIFNSSAGYNVTVENNVIPNEQWRLEIKIKNILNTCPSTLALQEVTQDEFEKYQSRLTGYTGVFSLHPQTFHGVAIFYKSSLFALIGAKKGIFQYQSGSYKGNLLKRRVHLIADLQHHLSGTIIRVVSCHLYDPRDWKSEMKSEHVKAVVLHACSVEPYSVDMVAICGDMNQDQFGDDVSASLKENPESVSLEKISAFCPFLPSFIQDDNLAATEYEKDLSQMDGDMLSKRRKTDWIFIQAKKDFEVTKLKGVVLKSAKLSNEYPNLQKKEHDLRGSDHALTLTKIQIKRTSF